MLKEELKIKVDELEETKNKLALTSSYAQNCEDSISFVSQTLKQSLSSGAGGKVTAKQVYSVLETIYSGILKTSHLTQFIERNIKIPRKENKS